MTPDVLTALAFTVLIAVVAGAAMLLARITGFDSWFTHRALKNLPERVRPERADPSISIWDADDYFHATGEHRLRLHELRRQLVAEKKETRDAMNVRVS